MKDRNDGCSSGEHNAPWNLNDEGECECNSCVRAKEREQRDNWQIDNKSKK